MLPAFTDVLHVANLTQDAQVYIYLSIMLPTFTDVLHVANLTQDAQVSIYL